MRIDMLWFSECLINFFRVKTAKFKMALQNETKKWRKIDSVGVYISVYIYTHISFACIVQDISVSSIFDGRSSTSPSPSKL